MFNTISEGINTAFQYFIDTVVPKILEFFQFVIDNKEYIVSAIAGIAAGFAALKIQSVIGSIGAFGAKVMSVLTGVTSLSAAFPGLASAIGLLTNPVFLVTAAVVAFVALIATKGDEIRALIEQLDEWLQSVFVVDWTNVFGPLLGDILNGFLANVKNIWDSVKQVLDGIITFIQGVFSGNWEQAWEGIKQILEGIWNAMVSSVKVPINAIISLINGLINGINAAINWLNSLKIDIPDWLGGGSFGLNLPTIGTIPYLAKGGVLTQGSAIVGEAGPELLTLSGGNAVVQPLTTNNNTTYGAININLYGNISSVEAAQEYSRIIAREAAAAMRGRGIVSI